MAVVKRARKQLDKGLARGPQTSGLSLGQRVDALKRSAGGPGDGAEAVVLGTGRAIEKCVSVASWFTAQQDCVVEVRTRTVGTVDDVVVEGDAFEDESRVRRVSAMEVTIRLR
jgi:ribonuclease P/MRP protein subunit POP7